MVTILKATGKQPSKAERFAQSISQGIEEGVDLGIKLGGQRRSNADKQKSGVRSALKTGLSIYDKNKSFDSDMTAKLEGLMNDYVNQGASANDAFTQAFSDIVGNEESLSSSGQTEGKSFWSKFSPIASELTSYPEKAGRQLAQMGRKGVGAIQGISDLLTPNKTSPIQGLAPHGRETQEQTEGLPALSFYDKLVGEKGIPRNDLEDVASSAIFGAPGIAGASAGVGLREAGLPEWAQHLGDIGIMILTQGGFSKFANGTKSLKKIADIAKETGVPADEILKATGVDLAKVAAGDEAAMSELSQRITEVPDISKKVSKSPKSVYNKEPAIREREVFGAKLPESPLEYYYDIEARNLQKETSKLPTTKVRQAEIRESLAPQERQLFEDMRSQKEQLDRVKKEKARSMSENDRSRLGVLEEVQARKLEQIGEDLKDLQFEMKYGYKRPTEEYIDSLISKKVKEFEEHIANPTEESVKKMSKDIAEEREYLARAEKLMERGELPGEIRPDTFIKMQQKYRQGYQAAVQKHQQIVHALKGSKDAASIRKIRESQDTIKLLNDRIKHLEGKIVTQTDKVKAMRALNKPSGAFYKNQIRQTRKDLEMFNHDLFKQKKHVKTQQEMKTNRLFKEQQKNIDKGRQFAENPTKEMVKEIAEENGITQEQAFKELNEIKTATKPVIEAIKNGTVTPNTSPKWIRTLKKNAPKWSKGVLAGAILGVIDEEFGWKLDNAYARGILALLSGSRVIPGAIVGKESVKWVYDHLQARYLKTLRGDIKDWNKYLENMERVNGKSKKNRVLSLANEH